MKAALFLCFVLFTATIFAQDAILPNQTFVIKVTSKNSNSKPESNPEQELIINSNKVSAGFSTKDGYPPAIIEVNKETLGNAVIAFTAGCTNAKNGALKWACTINGNRIEGKAQQFFMGVLSGEYVFTGTLKPKK